MDVRMPDGTVITGVPDGITQTELLARYSKFNAPAQEAVSAPAQPVPQEPKGIAALAEPAAPKQYTAEEYKAAVAKRNEETPERTVSDAALDTGITLLKGAIGLPESFVGLADIPSKGAIGKFLEDAGYNPREANAILDTYLSEAQQSANRKVAETKGFLPTIGAALQNPSTIATGVGESLPQMIGGAGIARGILKAAPKVGAVVAGGLGEGILGAGSAAEQIRGENKDKLLTGEQSLAALGSGVGTAAFGIAGGRLANKFGLDDIDTMLASGASRGGAKSVMDFAKRATGSGISEGLFEEMPQSAQEKMWMNYATDKPLMEGVPEAMGMGLTTGFAMGVAGGGAGSVMKKSPEQEIADAINGVQYRPGEQEAPSKGATPTDLESLARSKGFLRPQAPQPEAPVTVPPSESMDLQAMMDELMGKPPVYNKVIVEEPTKAESVKAEEPPKPEEPAKAEEPPAAKAKTEPAMDLGVDAQKYDIPDLRLKQADAFGNDVTGLLYEEMESHGRAALKNRGLTQGYANKKDALVDASHAAMIAFGTGDFSVFQPYAQTFPKLAKKLQAHLTAETKAEPAQQGNQGVAPVAPVAPAAKAQAKPVEDRYIPLGQTVESMELMNDDAAKMAREEFENEHPDESYDSEMWRAYRAGKVDRATAESKTRTNEQGGQYFWAQPLNNLVNATKVAARADRGDKNAIKLMQNMPEFAEWFKQVKAKGTESRKLIQDLSKEHKKRVQQALSEGKPVPQEVLDDHPELSAKAAPATSDDRKAVLDAYKAFYTTDATIGEGAATAKDTAQFKLERAISTATDSGRPVNVIRTKGQIELRSVDQELPKGGKLIGTIQPDPSYKYKTNAQSQQGKAQAKATKPKAKTSLDKVAHLRKQSWEKNPLMAYLADKGLYHVKDDPKSLKNEFSPDKSPMIAGYGPIFKSSGLKIDALLPIAIQDGFVPQNATEDDLYSLIQQAFSGKRIEALYKEQGQEDLAKKYEERQAQEEPDYEERVGQSDAEWYGMSEDDYVNMMANEVAATSDADFAELNEAVSDLKDTPASNISERAAMELLGFTEEEIQNEERRAAEKAGKAAATEEATGNEPGQAAPDLELQAQTAEELKAKQDEIDRLTKENERLAKQAEAKAKADAERDEFVLTGSDRPADVAAAQGQKDIFGAMEEEAPVAKEEPKLSKSYEIALDESTKANEEYSKALLDYRAGKINDDQFLVERKKHDLAVAKFDQAFNEEQNRAQAKPEVAEEVVPAAEKPAAPQLTREPFTFEGEFTEVGEEKQRALITTQVEKLSDAQTATLEKFYGLARDTEEFANAVRQDVVNFITKGATYVNGKIRAIIRSMANGVLSVAVAFNPQFVSMPYTIAVPQFETRTEQVMQDVPDSVQKMMSDDAKRAYATIYPAIKEELQANDKFFIVADKQTANTFVFNPDGTPFMQSKTLFGVGIGDFVKGNNNIVSNRITPAGLFDLGLRDAKRSVDEAATAGEYDFGKVFVLDKSQKGANGFYSTTIMHSVWTKEADAKQRLAALQKPGAEDSRYSFGCINVDKTTYGNLVAKNLAQMDGAKIFIVPENGTDVMSFVNGKATYSTDIIRQRAEPVTKEVKQEVRRATETAEAERTVVAKEEEGPTYFDFSTRPVVEEEKKRSPSFKRRMDKLNRDRLKGKITDEQFVNEADWALKQAENARIEKPVAERVRGADFIRQKLLEAKRKGDLSEEAVDLAEWFVRNNEQLVEELGISVRSPGASGVGGQYSTLNKIIILMKDAGSNLTVVHEILHHLERMMPPKVQQAIREAWAKQLISAQKKAKSPAEQLYFKMLIDAHYGGNNFDFVEVPEGEMSKVFMQAMADLQFETPGSKSSIKMAETLLKMGLVPYGNYQYFNPSEFWAVNGSDIVQGRFDAVQGGVLARLKNWLKELGQKIKGLFGLDSKASIIQALDSLAKGDGTFVTKEMLGEGEYKNIRRNYEGNEAPAASWESPEESKMDNFIYKLQDKLIDTKRVIQSIKKASGEIADNWDAYLKEELFHGRAAKRTQDFMNREMLPILEEMKDEGVTLAQFEEYLHMRHAEERNALVAQRNPKLQDQGSGVKTADAVKYLAELTDEQRKTFESLAKKFDRIIDNTQKLLVDSGLETQETIDAWNGAYEHYVPLMRDDLDFKHHGKGMGAGYSTRGGSSKSAVGSTKKVIDIFANVALQRERAIVRAEKARVGRALYGLAIKNPNPGFWLPINPEAVKNKGKLIEELQTLGLSPEDAENIIQEPKVPTIDKKTGLVKYEVNPLMRNSDNVFPVRINGEDRYIFFNTSDERAIRMVEALKNLDAEQLGAFLGSVATVTRWISSVNTQFNPVFGLWNFARDVQGAAFNLTTTQIAGHEKEVIKNVLPALKGIYTDLRENRKKGAGESEWAKLFERFELAGGQTGYRDQFSQTEKRANIVKREMEKLDRGNFRKAAAAVFDWLSDYNDAMENAVRLSAFKVALDQGLSEERAASIAKNLTVNFNRKGASSPTLQSLYAFFNAAVQGTTRLAQTLSGPAGKKIMAGGLAIGVAQAIALAMAGYDDDDPPEFLKNKNLILPVPGGNYLIVPMPLGFNIFPGIGRLTTEYVLGKAGMITGAKGASDKLVSIASLMLDAFNPLGSGSVLQMATPTIADPVMAVYGTNRDAFGRPISKEDRATAPTPGYTRSRENASWFSKQLAEFLNYVSSPAGTKYTKGLISPTADQIDYLIGQYTGGTGREVMKAAEYATAVVKGETGELPSYRIPIVGKLYGETESPAAVSSKFYENVTKLAEHENEIKMRIKNKDDLKEYRAEHPETRFINRANNLENQITAINKQKKALQEREAPEERIKKLDERKTLLMKQLNDQIKSLERQ